jgi:2-haloacid dehalogenase
VNTSAPATADRWVLFDLDGTLFDYHASEAEAVRSTLGDAGVEVTDEIVAVYRDVNAQHWRELERGRTTAAQLRLERWDETFAAIGVRPTVDVEVLAERYLGHLAAGTHLVDGAAEVVARVGRSHGVTFLTNGLADVQRPRLSASPLADLADAVIISDEVGAAKPDPAIFDAAFAAMGGPPRDAVTLVGDSLSADVAGGVGYGLRTVWVADVDEVVPDDAPRADHRIASLYALPALLGV